MSGSLNIDYPGGDVRRTNSKSSPKRSSGHLQRFVEAKRKISGIFGDLREYVGQVNSTLCQIKESRDLVTDESLAAVGQLSASVSTICDMLQRNHMKVVFFGRTSNGKSTVVNAMLHSKILPQGMGHTTRCFLQSVWNRTPYTIVHPFPVGASADGRKYVVTSGSEGDGPEQDVDTIESLGSALGNAELGEDAMVKIYWPAADSRLLENEVVLVDSPGVDLSPEFDSWIDKHCVDADVFVLVSNAESTLTQAEKNFFHRVSAKLSRPNLFILNNRWDASANEPESMERVREQHMRRLSTFLVDELGVCRAEEVGDRVFFVSAKEVLHQRLKSRGVATPTSFLADGWQTRSLEWSTFEEHFETLISESAIHTKFSTHLSRGQGIASRLQGIIAGLEAATADEVEERRLGHQTELAALRESQRKLLHFVGQSKEQISRLSAEVQLRVADDFRDTIRRLEGTVDSYRKPFDDSPALLPTYKADLIAFVDSSVSADLNMRFTGGLRDSIERTQRQMIDNVSLILPEGAGAKASAVLSYREPFRFAVNVDCAGLAEDFAEDLEFRFSLGFAQLVRRAVALRRAAMGAEEDGGGTQLLPRALSGEMSGRRGGGEDEDQLMRGLILTSASYVANGGVGLLLIGGLVYRTLGWRVIAVCGGAYAGIYFWERARWNGHAKEQHLKDQLRRHLASRLRQLSQIITHNCDAQVTREVQEVLTRLQSVANEAHQELKGGIEKLRKDIDELEAVQKKFQATKGRATFIGSEMESYAEKFLGDVTSPAASPTSHH